MKNHEVLIVMMDAQLHLSIVNSERSEVLIRFNRDFGGGGGHGGGHGPWTLLD